MKAFYCDQFVLPLPETHSFPMAKYRKLRERVLSDAIIDARSLIEPPAASFDQLTLAHHSAYVDDVFGSPPSTSGASGSRGRRAWSNARDGASAGRSPRRASRARRARR